MANYNASARRFLGDVGFGLRVDRATTTLPQGASDDLFTVYVGLVQLHIQGEVTTLIGGANATNLEFLPTCATGARNDLCAQLDINGDVIGTIYSITGTAANAMVDSAATFWTIQRTPIILAPGTIELHCAGSVTGAIAWTVWYYPLEPGAYVAAV